MSAIAKMAKYLTVLAFLSVLCLPLLQQLTNFIKLPVHHLREKRRHVPFPHFSFKELNEFPKEFDRYYGDNFGFRDLLIKLNNTVRFSIFNVSPTKTVLLGKNNWLFHTGNHSVEFYQGTNLFSKLDLKRLALVYETRRKYLESLGINYYIFIPTNKESIYPEFYPDDIPRITKITRYDQVVDYLRVHTKLKVVGPKQALLKEKHRGQLYRKSDGHWNSFGAYFAYQHLYETLHKDYPNIVQTPIDDFRLTIRYEEGELGRMLGLLFPVTFETPFLKARQIDPWFMQAVKSKKKPLRIDRSRLIRGRNDLREDQIPKLLVYRDSFFIAITRFISRHFEQSVYYTTHKYQFDPITIEHEKPTIVIDELVERYLRVPNGSEVPIINARLKQLPFGQIGQSKLILSASELTSAFEPNSIVSLSNKTAKIIATEYENELITRPLNLDKTCSHLLRIDGYSEKPITLKIFSSAKPRSGFREVPSRIELSPNPSTQFVILPYPAVPQRLRFNIPTKFNVYLSQLEIRQVCRNRS